MTSLGVGPRRGVHNEKCPAPEILAWIHLDLYKTSRIGHKLVNPGGIRGRACLQSGKTKRKDKVPYHKSCSGIITAGRIVCATICIWASALQSVEIRKCIGIPGGRFVFQHRYEALLFIVSARGSAICTSFGSVLLYIDRFFQRILVSFVPEP